MPQEESLSRDDRVNEAIAAYLQAVERGEKPALDSFLAQYADIAAELGSFFGNAAQFQKLAGAERVAFGSDSVQHASSNPSKPPKSDPNEPTMKFRQRDVSSTRSVLRYFGDYELIEEIARGGMGVVYKARQTTLNRIVAVKMILAGQFAGPEDVQRFQIEAEAAAQLDHPGIVPIFEVGEHHGQHYFSMGFVDGQSLAKRVAEGPLEPRAAAEIVKSVSEAVQFAHDKGVIHRDLKPGNILLGKEGRPRVTDFGLAKLLESGSDLTGTGQILGTPSYMPPEQAASQVSAVGRLSDVYSLGAILYCLLTGRPPFQAASPLETLLQVQKQEPVSPRQLNPNIPLDLDTIILKCLDKSPTRRYASAQSLADELNRYLEGRPILARPVDRIERIWRWCRRNPLVASLGATVLLTLVASTIVSSYFALRERQQAIAEIIAKDEEKKQRLEAIKQAGIANQETQRAELALAAEKSAKDDALLKEKIAREQTQLAESRRFELQKGIYLTDMNRIEEFAKVPNIERIRSLLKRHLPQADEPDLRGWEWFYWWDYAHREQVVLQHDLPIQTLAVSPDEHTLAVGLERGWIQLWNLATDECRPQPLRVSTNSVAAVGFLDDGSRLGAADDQGQWKIWKLPSGEIDRQRMVSKSDFTVDDASPRIQSHWSAAISADGRRLLSGNFDSVFGLWPWTSRRPVEKVIGPSLGLHIVSLFSGAAGQSPTPVPINYLRINPRGGEAFEDRVTQLNSPGPPQASAATFREHLGAPSFGLCFAPDGKSYASGDREGRVQVWDSSMHSLMHEFAVGKGVAWSIAFRGDGRALAAGSDDGTVKVWKLPGGDELASLIGHVGSVRAMAFLPDGESLATAGRDGSLRVWHLATGREVLQLLGHTGTVRSVATLGGHKLISGGVDGTVRVWNAARSSTEYRATKPLNSGLDPFAISGDGSTLLGVNRLINGPQFQIFDTVRGILRRSIAGDRFASATALQVDGQRMAVATGLGTLELLDIPSGRRLVSKFQLVGKTTDTAIVALCFSSDGKQLAGLRRNHAAVLFDAESLDVLQSLLPSDKSSPMGIGHLPSISFCHDGTQLFCHLGRGKPILSYDLKTGRETGRSDEGEGQLSPSLMFDGKTVVVHFRDHAVEPLRTGLRILDAVTLKPLREVLLSADPNTTLAASPREPLVAFQNSRGIVLWNVEQQSEVKVIPTRAIGQAMRFSPDGSRLYVVQAVGTIHRIDVARGVELPELGIGAGPIESVALSPNEGRVATWSSGDGRTCGLSEFRLNPDERDEEAELSAHQMWLTLALGVVPQNCRMEYVVDSSCLLGPSGFLPVRLVRGATSPSPLYPQFANGSDVIPIDRNIGSIGPSFTLFRLAATAVSRNGMLIATADDKGNVLAWRRTNPETFEVSHRWQAPANAVSRLAISADERQVVIGSQRAVHVWDLEGDQKHSIKESAERPTDLAFDAKGHWLAVGDRQGIIRLFERPSLALRQVLKGHTGSVTSVGFPPDCRTLLSTGEDGTLRAWDLESGELKLTLVAHRGSAGGLDIGRKTGLVVTGGHDGLVRKWPTSRPDQVEAEKIAFAAIKLPEKSPDEKLLPAPQNTSDHRVIPWLRETEANVSLSDAGQPLAWNIHSNTSLPEIDFTISSISFPQTNAVDDESLARLADLEGLTHLNLNGTLVRGAGLAYLAKLPSLQSLDLSGLPITDADLAPLSRLGQITSLNLSGTKIGNDSLINVVRQMPRLQTLYLNDTAITDEGLRGLSSCGRIWKLELNNTRARGKGLVELSEPLRLVNLKLDGTEFDDETVETLLRFENLQTLLLRGTKLTDVGIASLEAAKHVSTLDISDTSVTFSAMKRFVSGRQMADFRLMANPSAADVGPEWRAAFLGWRHHSEIDVDGRPYFTNESAMTALDAGGHVTGVSIPLDALTDADLKLLVSLPRLTRLSLSAAARVMTAPPTGTLRKPVPSSGNTRLQHLKDFPHLTMLSLAGQDIGNEDVAFIAGLQSLTSLELRNTSVAREGLLQLAKLDKLTEFKVESAQFDLADLAQLPFYRSLRRLGLKNHKFAADDFRLLEENPVLEWLDLQSSAGVAAGVPSLKRLTRLKFLGLKFGLLPYTVINEIKQMLPGCEISY